jgi:hypothetical protein
MREWYHRRLRSWHALLWDRLLLLREYTALKYVNFCVGSVDPLLLRGTASSLNDRHDVLLQQKKLPKSTL